MTLLLDISLSVAQQRVAQHSNPDRFEQLDSAFFERTRKIYLDRAATAPQRYHIINSNQPLAEVAAQINQSLSQLFGYTA